MPLAHTERRIYSVASTVVFGACATTLGQMRAVIDYHDIERGVILATLGAGFFGSGNVIMLTIRSVGDTTTEVSASWRARGFGRNYRTLQVFFETLEQFLAPALRSPEQSLS